MSAHLMTIDLDGASPARDGDGLMTRLLETLDRAGRRATFFVPKSRTASRQLVARISEAGHEVAALTKSSTTAPYSRDFQAELKTLRNALEAASGQRVRGHRHLDGLDDDAAWVYDVLLDEGFEYDSSWRPTPAGEMRSPGLSRSVRAERRWNGTLLEVPTTTSELDHLPVILGSVRSIRRVPLPVLRQSVRSRERRGKPSMVRLRESELRRLTKGDSDAGSRAERRTISRLGTMLGWVPFAPLGDAIPELLRGAPIIER